MKFQPILTWFDERTGLVSGAKHCNDRKIAIDSCVCPMKLLPSAIIFCVVLQAVSGFFLWSFYSPSTTTAWESVHYIQNDLSGGWLLRGIHHYSAQVLVFLLAFYIVGSVFRGLYRSPREFVFWIALLMGCLALGACLTGDLLGWTGLGYSATKVRTGFLQMIPVIGYDLYKLAIGGPGPDFSSHTLTRFLALHVGVMGGGIIGLTFLWRIAEQRASKLQLEKGATPGYYWPNKAVYDMAVWCAVLVVVLLLCIPHHGAPLRSPADPSAFDGAARPEWSFRALYHFCHYFSGNWQILPVFVFSTMVMGYFFLIPLVEKIKLGVFLKMPIGHVVNMGVVGFITLAGIWMTWASYHKDGEDEDYLINLEANEVLTERVLELAGSPEGIPPEGALFMMKNDPYIQGPALFDLHCASCHSFDDGTGSGIVCESPTAPNLYDVGKPDWIAGWLDPERIVTHDYLGGTSFADGEMVRSLNGSVRTAREFRIELEAIGAAEAAFLAAEEAFENVEDTYDDAEDAVSDLEKDIEDAQEDIEKANEDIEEAEAEIAAADEAIAAGEEPDEDFDREELEEDIADAQEDIEKANAELAEAQPALPDAEAAFIAAQPPYLAAQEALTKAESELMTLEDVFRGRVEPDEAATAWIQIGETNAAQTYGRLVELLADEAALNAPRAFDGLNYEGLTDEDAILFQDFSCNLCHEFYDREAIAANGPVLTGYASRDWLIGAIEDPGRLEYYGESNEMPAFRASPEEATLSEREIEMLTDWMLGRWYRPGEAEAAVDETDAEEPS